MLGNSCVTTTKVTPRVSRRRRMRSSSALEVSGSRPALGSSRKSISGSRASARAIAARFFMPPERSLGILSAASRSPTRSSCMSASVRRAAAGRRVNSSSGSITFSSTFIDPNSAPDWYITPIFRNILARFAGFISNPATETLPPSTGFNPIKCFMIVDLPQPLPPRSANTSPRDTEKFTSCRTGTPTYPASRCSTSITVSAMRHTPSR